ncbi:MAG: cell division protein FtsQ/DivIB [Gammaproteobacteria bacterium]
MNPWHDARLLNFVANLLFGLTLLCSVGVALWWLSQRPYFALRTIEVEPRPGVELRHVSTPVLRATVASGVRGNFFATDLAEVRAVFETVPWIRRATVRRVWPDGLVVEVEEHRALALWADGRLVDTFGQLFTANLAEAEENGPLPQLSGPPGTALEVARRYAELRRAVAQLEVAPEAVALSDRHAWTLRLNDGTTLLLGRDEGMPIERRLARWIHTYPQVMAQLNRRAELIDLRYPNGFAIRSLAMLGDEQEPAPAASRRLPQR